MYLVPTVVGRTGGRILLVPGLLPKATWAKTRNPKNRVKKSRTQGNRAIYVIIPSFNRTKDESVSCKAVIIGPKRPNI